MNLLAGLLRGGVSVAPRRSGLLLLAAIITSHNASAAVVNWTNLNGGLWSAATNWSPHSVPAPADDVVIASPGTYTVAQDLHVTIASLTLGGASGTQTLTNVAANLTLNGASTVKATGVLGLSGGSLAAEGGLTVEGKLLWDAGTISGWAGGAIIVTNNGTLQIGGSGTKYLNGIAKLINHASVVWSGPNDIEMGNSARILNQLGALFDIQNNRSISIGNGGAITNLGTVRKSAGGGNTLIIVPIYNSGTLEVQSGLVAYGPSSWFNDGTAFTGTGTNLVYSGTITFDGSLSSENLEISGPAIAGNSFFSGTVNWTSGALGSGTLTLATNGVLNVKGSETKYVNGTGTLINYGSVVWSGSNDIIMGNSGRIINQLGALFDIQNNQSIAIGNGGAVTNLGTLRKSAGGGNTFIIVPIYNSGTLDVRSGLVAYGPSSRFNDGTAFTGGGTNLVYAGTITFDGSLASENLEINGPTITGNGLFSGLVNWTGGELFNGVLAIATNGVLNITGSGAKTVTGTGTLVNYGSVVWSGTNDITTMNSARIINQPGALFDILNNQALAIWNGGAITNLGTLRKSMGGGSTFITVPMYNFGTLDVRSGLVAYSAGSQFNDGTSFTGAGTNLVYAGTVSFNGAIASQNLEIGGAAIGGHSLFSGVVNWTAGTLSDNSVFAIATNGLLKISGQGTKYLTGTGTLLNQGSVVWSGTNDLETSNYARIINQAGALFDIQNDQSLTIWNGGAITNLGTLRKSAGGGNTLVNVPMNNAGTVDVQSGKITFGSFNQIGGKLSFGLNSLTDFGRLAFANSVAFTGTLGVSLNGGYIPVAGNSFPVITYPARTGGFTGFELPASHAWQTDATIYGATVLTLTVLNTFPALAPVSAQAGDEETLITFTATATDPDPGQTCAFSLLGPPPGATISPNTGAFSWTPTEPQGPATNLITILATDSGTPALSATQAVTIIVSEVNRAPVPILPPTQAIDELLTLTVTNFATDADIPANTVAYRLVSAPPGVNLDTTTGVLTWTPTEAQGPGTNTIKVAVVDNGSPPLSATNDFTVMIREVNSAPSLTVPSAQTLDELTTLCVTNVAADSDLPANALAFRIVSAPPGVNLDTATGVLTWTPTEAQGPATNTIKVAVVDNGSPPLSATNDFTAIVREANSAPSLTVPSAQTFDELTTVCVTNVAADSDLPSNTFAFMIVSAPPGVNLDTTTGVLTWTPTEAQGPGTNMMTIAVTDNGIPPLSVTNSFTVTVLESNVPPVLAAIPELAAIEAVPLLYTNSATDADLPANTLEFDLVSSPSGMTVDAATGVLLWKPSASQVPSTNLVTLRVTDNGQPAGTDIKSFSVVAYPLPFLTILPSGTNVVLSWPAYAAGFALEQAMGLEPPAFWADTTNAVSLQGGMKCVTNRVDGSRSWFRLHYGVGTSQP